eukprot:CAMPEP_0201510712 /NCGR_PEP_ID=MMETSP0161_2-20130828/3296_1 /ASSEMBLY_ACC=CAM_ASM_000251 /TAXON_ID=180227 /ORGANISM="Neoparamoeba aestuarina, Strain SoJaBio B1-5/56/2" /LENGTH=935 /DNA_ID=CAMNT_0047905929 /DNA_START=42 /DNA_END=2849 /DNA_ORIENTATION=+
MKLLTISLGLFLLSFISFSSSTVPRVQGRGTDLERSVERALEVAKNFLSRSKHPRAPSDVAHEYDDKYLLSEFLAKTSIAATINILEIFGLENEVLDKLAEWPQDRPVILSFDGERRCKKVGEREKDVETGSSVDEKEEGGLLWGTKKTKKTHKVYTKVTEYDWEISYNMRFTLYDKQAKGERDIVLKNFDGKTVITTTYKTPPMAEKITEPKVEVDLSWLLMHLQPIEDHSEGASRAVTFSIDRDSKDCHTPRRNEQIEASLNFYAKMQPFFQKAVNFIEELARTAYQGKVSNVPVKFSAREVFVPLIPFFDDTYVKGQGNKTVLPYSYANDFLKEQHETLHTALLSFFDKNMDDHKYLSPKVKGIALTANHALDLLSSYVSSLNYIENMLINQLMKAIGSELSPSEFRNHMTSHSRSFFKGPYKPSPFSFPIRRPNHSPEGVLSIESQENNNPIYTLSKTTNRSQPFYFPINSATRAGFVGDQTVHGWVTHQFSHDYMGDFTLNARARQFSSFVLMVGRITGKDEFDPESAIIVQNKDEVIIPLLLNPIPTPKQFRDAILSLSPEQQRFARKIRELQLSSTTFAVAVIQIKPQLEKLLNIPSGGLTKHIKLSEDLLELFIEYQIPSDFLTYDGKEDAEVSEKVARVSELVKEMKDVIDQQKEEQLEEARKEQEYRDTQRRFKKKESFGIPRKDNNILLMEIEEKAVELEAQEDIIQEREIEEDGLERASVTTFKESGNTNQNDNSASNGDIPQPVVEKIEKETLDLTQLPHILDKNYEKYDLESYLHPTTIKTSSSRFKKHAKSLFSPVVTNSYNVETETHKALDLLDALSRSGSLLIEDGSLHVITAATHQFNDNLLDTLIKKNVNPIEKIERSELIVAKVIHGLKDNGVEKMVEDRQVGGLCWSGEGLVSDDFGGCEGGRSKLYETYGVVN